MEVLTWPFEPSSTSLKSAEAQGRTEAEHPPKGGPLLLQKPPYARPSARSTEGRRLAPSTPRDRRPPPPRSPEADLLRAMSPPLPPGPLIPFIIRLPSARGSSTSGGGYAPAMPLPLAANAADIPTDVCCTTEWELGERIRLLAFNAVCACIEPDCTAPKLRSWQTEGPRSLDVLGDSLTVSFLGNLERGDGRTPLGNSRPAGAPAPSSASSCARTAGRSSASTPRRRRCSSPTMRS